MIPRGKIDGFSDRIVAAIDPTKNVGLRYRRVQRLVSFFNVFQLS
jgi:hypothetical protein